jgi:hypothetical protein
VLVIFILAIFVCPSRITAFDYLFDILKGSVLLEEETGVSGENH